MKKSIVWGTCWYNESVETLIKFLKESIASLKKMNFTIVPIVFDARYIHNAKDLKLLKKEINGVKIILNKTNIFPNKNYGVAAITNEAFKLNIPYIAIVDSDWSIKENYMFATSIINTLVDGKCDILIPDIASASGRSNILIGRTVINLFYPEYKNTLKSAFPGALAAVTKELYQIVNDPNYHYDWGGEWDIISLGISKNKKINSAIVEVENIKHRSNKSKMQDSFQIWKAIFENDDIIDRYKHVKEYKSKKTKFKLYSMIDSNDSIIDIINKIKNSDPTKTQEQILYMILYPLALLMGEIDEAPTVETKDEDPYDKKELYEISDFAIYCMKKSLETANIKKINQLAKTVKGKYYSKWNKEEIKNAINKVEVI